MSEEQKPSDEFVDALWVGFDDEEREAIELKARRCLFEGVDVPAPEQEVFSAARALFSELLRVVPPRFVKEGLKEETKNETNILSIQFYSMFEEYQDLYLELHFVQQRRSFSDRFGISLWSKLLPNRGRPTKKVEVDGLFYDYALQRFWGITTDVNPIEMLCEKLNKIFKEYHQLGQQ